MTEISNCIGFAISKATGEREKYIDPSEVERLTEKASSSDAQFIVYRDPTTKGVNHMALYNPLKPKQLFQRDNHGGDVSIIFLREPPVEGIDASGQIVEFRKLKDPNLVEY